MVAKEAQVARLVRLQSPLPGDVNSDGVVNMLDVTFVTAHWGESGPVADANGDMMVNIFDINLISANWTPTGGAASATAVPEPATLILALCGLVGVVCRRGRHPIPRRRTSACSCALRPNRRSRPAAALNSLADIKHLDQFFWRPNKPVTPADLTATILHHLGIDHTQSYVDEMQGLRHRLCEGQPIMDLG